MITIRTQGLVRIILAEYIYMKYYLLYMSGILLVTNLFEVLGVWEAVGLGGTDSVMYMVAIMSFPMNWLSMFKKNNRAATLIRLPVAPMGIAILRTFAPIIGVLLLISTDLMIKFILGMKIPVSYQYSLSFGFAFYMLVVSGMSIINDMPNINLNLGKDRALNRSIGYVAIIAVLTIGILIASIFIAKSINNKSFFLIISVLWGIILQILSVTIFRRRQSFV